MEGITTRENRLALFDFDGTLTTKDTMLEFVKFAKGNRKFWLGMIWLSPMLLLNKIGIISSGKAKQIFLKHFFGGCSEKRMKTWGEQFCSDLLPTMFRDLALEKLLFHRSKGHTVYVVTASLDIWVRPWLQAQNLKGICSKARFSEGIFHGELEGPNCNGPEKARRLKEELKLEDFEKIFAYGDSSGDKAMLALAHKPFYRRFL
jgi:HAD superfamily hydrolase (TIGR01490 family)